MVLLHMIFAFGELRMIQRLVAAKKYLSCVVVATTNAHIFIHAYSHSRLGRIMLLVGVGVLYEMLNM